MTKFLLASRDEDWSAKVRESFGGSLNGELRTTARVSPDELVDTMQEIDTIDPAVFIVGPDVDTAAALHIARAVDEQRPDVSVVIIADPSPALLEQAVRAGVRDVVDPVASLEDVRASLQHAFDTATKRRSTLRASMPETATSKVIAVVSPKGGAGKTALTTNLAVGLGRVAPHEVVIVDLDLQFGDVSNALRLTPERTMADVARSGDVLDATTVKAFLEPHPSNVFVLCAPESPAEADGIKPDMIRTTIDLLAEMFRYVIIDTAAGLDEATLTAMEHCSDIVVVCGTDVSSARGLRKELEAFDMLGLTTQRRHFVLNRSDARVGLSTQDIESTVGLDVTVAIPSSRAMPTAMNQGAPILESDQRTPLARALGELVSRFAGPQAPVSQAARPANGGLFRRTKETR